MSFDTKKYSGYTEMLFKHRKSTLTRKKALATFLTSDEKEIQLYDFYNKYYFFMKFVLAADIIFSFCAGSSKGG